MNSRSTKTPYNSIYEPITKNAPKADELCCCLHGVQCVMGKANLADAAAATEKQEDEQYVNLMAPTAESKMVSQLTKKLHKLAADERASRKCEAVSLESLQQLPPPPAQPQYRKPYINPTDHIMLGTEKDQTTTFSKVTDDSNFKSCAASVYLGVMTRSQAEQQVANITEFAIYHHFSKTAKLATISDALPLILVYRTSANQFKHYPIRTNSSSGGEVQYFVDYGRANVRKHWSLNQLVKYYQTHVSFDANNQAIADVFSDWHD
ncbi:unnamed protein product [Caenorhabditis angaria]|uniref:SH2 domain-containing protein n=1 Tax=Caenorhabditis angaria TaxID=860376 RepID=A0A9P1MVK6_9PELO|nr:unnamed protein product [Caenorhabditis angaria]